MQRQFTAIRLEIGHSIHLGSFREDYETSETRLHSDAFYAAIVQAWSSLGVAHPLVSEVGLTEAPPLSFVVSSLFPFFKANEKSEPTYFFPVPTSGLPLKNESLRDRIKHVQWLDGVQFRSLLETGFLKNEDVAFVQGKFYTAPNAGFEANFMQTDLHPRVYVPRVGETNDKNEAVSDTVIFYLERLFFREGCGLFCLAQFDDESIKTDVETALDFLQTEGLGTDRHVGHGQFEYKMDDFEAFADLPVSDFSLNLSLFCPESQAQLSTMLDPDRSRYSLLKRGGWITSEPDLSVRKDSIYMFREGGIFKTNLPSAGKTWDLRPREVLGEGHPIWRVGRSLFLPVTVV